SKANSTSRIRSSWWRTRLNVPFSGTSTSVRRSGNTLGLGLSVIGTKLPPESGGRGVTPKSLAAARRRRGCLALSAGGTSVNAVDQGPHPLLSQVLERIREEPPALIDFAKAYLRRIPYEADMSPDSATEEIRRLFEFIRHRRDTVDVHLFNP